MRIKNNSSYWVQVALMAGGTILGIMLCLAIMLVIFVPKILNLIF